MSAPAQAKPRHRAHIARHYEAGDVGAERLDDPRGFKADTAGQGRLHRRTAGAQCDFGPIEANRMNSKTDLVGTRLADRGVLYLENIGTAKFVDAD